MIRRILLGKRIPTSIDTISRRWLSSDRIPLYWKDWQDRVVSQGKTNFKSKFELPTDDSSMKQMIQAVVKMKGNVADFVPQIVTESLCEAYLALDFSAKKQFLLMLARTLHSNAQQVDEALTQYEKSRSNVAETDRTAIDWSNPKIESYLKTHRELRDALIPVHELLYRQILSQKSDGMLYLVNLRADLLQVIRKTEKAQYSELYALRDLDASLKNLLASWFDVMFLHLERITYEHSPGILLEKIIRYEAVHPVGTIIELKRRLGHSRRCFAFFHPSIPFEPLVFVHVAMVKGLADSMEYINQNTGEHVDEQDSDTAIFYSISSTQSGLSGIDLGNFLIKKVAKRLEQDHPHIKTYSTLSPIPKFIPWLRHKISQSSEELISKAEAETLKMYGDRSMSSGNLLLHIIDTKGWYDNEELAKKLEPILLRLAARYLYLEKRRKKALCSVANFHIRNGAVLERLNWLADPSAKGLSQSAGIMVNYKYELDQVEKNNEQYILAHKIETSDRVL